MKPIVSKEMFIRTYKSKRAAKIALKQYAHLLPIIPSPELAKIVGFLMTDGFIDVREYYNSLKYSYVGYFSKYKKELISFRKLIAFVLHAKGKITSWGVRERGRSFGFIITNNFITRILTLCGVPSGRKTNSRYKIPEWVRHGSFDIKRAFLQASFDSEGSIHFSTSRKCWEIKYTMYKIVEAQDDCVQYLEQLRELLNECGIKSSRPFRNGSYLRKDKKNVQGFMIRIEGKERIEQFRKQIGFSSAKKKHRLVRALKNGPAVI